MFGLKKTHLKTGKHTKVDTECPDPPRSNPFDSDDKLDNKQNVKTSRKTSSEPSMITPNISTSPFDDDEERGTSSSSLYSLSSAAKYKYKNDFRDSGGLENQSAQELENYAVYKAEENTKAVNGCLKIAEEIREDAAKTLITLHQQGEQIIRTHNVAVEMDHDLSRV